MDKKMDILNFIEKSPCSFLAVDNLKKSLNDLGYEELAENKAWNLRTGHKYYVTRNGSSLLAFRLPSADFRGFVIGAAHDESPSYKVKWNSEMTSGGYVQLSVEPYGGMNSAAWLDRPLSVAGRVFVRENGGLVCKTVNIDRDLLLIPSVAVHLTRKKQGEAALNPAVDMQPLYGTVDNCDELRVLLAEACGTTAENIQSFDLFLYNRMQGSRWGKDGCFISAPRIDDLACVYALLEGFVRKILIPCQFWRFSIMKRWAPAPSRVLAPPFWQILCGRLIFGQVEATHTIAVGWQTASWFLPTTVMLSTPIIPSCPTKTMHLFSTVVW